MRIRQQIMDRVLKQDLKALSENILLELYNKYILMTEEVAYYKDFFLELSNPFDKGDKSADVNMENLREKMGRVGLNMVRDLKQL